MLELREWLSSEAAMRWIAERQQLVEPAGALDVDPLVIASGYGGSGAGVYAPARGASLTFDETRGGVIVDGSVVCDGLVQNRGVVFVLGNLVCRGLYNSGYLVIAGDLYAERFLGENEPGGTIIVGGCQIGEAVTLHVHQYSVWGEQQADLVDDEAQGTAAARQRLCAWGLMQPEEEPYPWPAIHERFRRWAEREAKALPEEPCRRAFTPRPPPPPAVRPSRALPPALVELERWLLAEGLTQRQKLEALVAARASALAGLAGAEGLDRGDAESWELARRLITKHLDSKKLAAAREALLTGWPPDEG